MSKIFIIKKKHLFVASIAMIFAVTCFLVWNHETTMPTASMAATRTIHMVTGEFKSTSKEGQKIEAYRWDPGTIVVQQGENIQLRIYGVNGESHPFLIEGLNIKGEVTQGKETIVNFTAKERGTYRIICLTHTDVAHEGPMIGYIVVQ